MIVFLSLFLFLSLGASEESFSPSEGAISLTSPPYFRDNRFYPSYELLQSAIEKQSNADFQGFHLFMLGDSTSSKLAKGFSKYFLPDQTIIPRCDLNKHLNLPLPSEWIGADLKNGIGPPSIWAQKHHGCRDCSSKSRVNQNISSIIEKDKSGEGTFSFLVMDSAKSREIETIVSKTTQEAQICEWAPPLLSSSSLSLPVYVLLNVGYHDCILPNSLENFEKNLIWLFGLFERCLPNAQIVWHSLSQGKGKKPQTTPLVIKMDNLGKKIAHENGAIVMDFFEVSRRFQHLLWDNLHHAGIFYQGKATLIRDFLAEYTGKKIEKEMTKEREREKEKEKEMKERLFGFKEEW